MHDIDRDCGMPCNDRRGWTGSAAPTETANVTTCLQMAEQVKTALEGNMQSANYDAAKKEQALAAISAPTAFTHGAFRITTRR